MKIDIEHNKQGGDLGVPFEKGAGIEEASSLCWRVRALIKLRVRPLILLLCDINLLANTTG
ncbi:hypothetical protein AVEN_44147-1, partial [Araneus ventricosus]